MSYILSVGVMWVWTDSWTGCLSFEISDCLVLIIRLCCIMLWRSVFTIHLFCFCSFCPCSAAAGCQENQGLSLCLQHVLCAQHRVTCSVPCIFQTPGNPFFTVTTSSPMKVVDFQQFSLPPSPVNPHMFPCKHCRTTKSDLFVLSCRWTCVVLHPSVEPQTLQPQTSCKWVLFYCKSLFLFLWVLFGPFSGRWSTSLWRYMLEESFIKSVCDRHSAPSIVLLN